MVEQPENTSKKTCKPSLGLLSRLEITHKSKGFK